MFRRKYELTEGDWLELFWDSTGEDLVDKMTDYHIPVNRLCRLLELAKDPYKDALTCEINGDFFFFFLNSGRSRIF